MGDFPALVLHVTTNVYVLFCVLVFFFPLSLHRHRADSCILSGAEKVTWELLEIRA